jgi:hypothetical protein
MGDTITIDKRFSGPPGCVNGGYMCGTAAAFVSPKQASVRLSTPAPLERALEVVRQADGSVSIQSGTTLVAQAKPAAVAKADIEVPPVPSLDEVSEAMARFPGLVKHPFETCFVCGTKREPRDGLRIFPGPVTGREVMASAWTPDSSLAGPDGKLDPVYVWASLDCPSGWAAFFQIESTMLVLGEITAYVDRVPDVGEPCVAVSWPRQRDGRKHFLGSALMSRSGEILGRAHATWLAIRTSPRAA